MTAASVITPAGTPIPRPSLSGKPASPCPAGVPAVVLFFEADMLGLESPTRLKTVEREAAVDKGLWVVDGGMLEVASGL